MKFPSRRWRWLWATPVYSSLAATAASLAPAPSAPPPAAKAADPGLEIRHFSIEGNSVLAPAQFTFLTNYLGAHVSFSRLREGLVDLQDRYHELGYPTITVTLPPQKLTNGTVHVKVIEGRLTRILVTGNHHFSTESVLRDLPGVRTNALLNTRWFQPELNEANSSRDRQIYPVIGPGPDPGTTELTLQVKDRLPWHGRLEVNDKSSPATPLLRTDAAVEYDNLWQRGHQLGVDYNFSPQDTKPGGSYNYLDQPEVTSYSTFYRLPLGSVHDWHTDYDQAPAGFGMDEITHKFNQPAPTGRPDLTFYASRSVSETPVRYGPISLVFTNPLSNLASQEASQSISYNNNFGARFNFPLRPVAGFNSSLSFGLDFKTYRAPSYSTNLSYFSENTYNSFGQLTNYGNDVITLPNNSSAHLAYLPLSVGWSGSRPDAQGGFSFFLNDTLFLRPLQSRRSEFQNVAGSAAAGGTDTSLNAGLVRQQFLPGGWSANLNLNGQWASAPLISNEEFALGGTIGVRGYEQGEIYGDDGWRALFDLRAAPLNVGFFNTPDGDTPALLTASAFMDYGQVYLLDRPANLQSAYDEWGVGPAFLLTAGEHFDARLALAWALANTPASHFGEARAYFSLGFQF